MIYSFVQRVSGSSISGNTKIEFLGYEISIAMDNCFGNRQNLSRTDIRVYDKNDEDITDLFAAEDEILSSGEALFNIMNTIRMWVDNPSTFGEK